MRSMKLIWWSLLCLIPYTVCSQKYDYGFQRDSFPKILKMDSSSYLFPYMGGMNSCQFSTIDLNEDSIKDLLVFEKNGNRILPFINNGQLQQPYRYAPEYIAYFPQIHDWIITKDYDGDGLEDLFTYSLAGIAVYKNKGNLKFELITDPLLSYYYNDYSNLFCSPDDYIVIEDLDDDGDLDILVFSLLGKYIHYHRNLSIEKYGNANTLDFRLEDECWGNFSEGESNNDITLFDDCSSKTKGDLRHTGSTTLAFDYDHDGIKDLLLGDVDYPNLILLRNKGSKTEALITSYTSYFPQGKDSVLLYSMPCANLIDIDNDAQKELIVSPFDPSLIKSQNEESVWVYEINDTLFERISTHFLQEDSPEHGSGSYPVFYDWNQDGLMDMFVANFGYYDSSSFKNYVLTSYYSSAISYYENIGNATTPVFLLKTKDFGNLKKLNYNALYPAFIDINHDGSTDMLCGHSDGTILYFQNTGSMMNPQFSLINDNYLNYDIGNFSTPHLFDLNQNGKQDLIIGCKKGSLTYFENKGNDNTTVFQYVTDSLGGVSTKNKEVSFFGYSVPCFFKTSENEIRLLLGSDQGDLYYYKNIEHNITRKYSLIDTAVFFYENAQRRKIKEGIRTGIAAADLNQDGYIDIMVGNYAGGLTFFSGCTPIDSIVTIKEYDINEFKIFPNPAKDYIQIQTKEIPIETTSLELYDITGKLVLSYIWEAYENKIQIPVHHLKQGIYFISRNRCFQKFIKL